MGGKNKKGRGASESSVQKVKKDIAYYEEMLRDPNVIAFLQVIRYGEGTLGTSGYHKLIGANDGVWGGARYFLSLDKYPNIHFNASDSSGAGAYQFVTDTWIEIANRLGLTNFHQHSQHLAALADIDGHKALPDILAGDLDKAYTKLSSEWSSLPGGVSTQHTKEELRKFYQQNGGTFHPVLPSSPVAAKYSEYYVTEDTKDNLESRSQRSLLSDLKNFFLAKDRFKIPELTVPGKQQRNPSRLTYKTILSKEDFDKALLHTLPLAIIESRYTVDTVRPGQPLDIRYMPKLEKDKRVLDSVRKAQLNIPKQVKKDSILKVKQGVRNAKGRDGRSNSEQLKKGASVMPHQSGAYQNYDMARLQSPVNYDSKWFISHASFAGQRNGEGMSQQYLTGEAISSDPTFSGQESISTNRNRYRISVNLNAPLIENVAITTEQTSEGKGEIRRQVELALLEVVNSINTA